MSSIIKVDQIQLADGSTPTAGDLGITGGVVNTQLFNVTPGSGITNTTSTFADFCTVNYTPVQTTSTLLITSSLILNASKESSQDARFTYRMTIDGTKVWLVDQQGIYDYGAGGIWHNFSHVQQYEHSNTTGSQIQIKVQAHTDGRATQVEFFADTLNRSTIHIMEIAG